MPLAYDPAHVFVFPAVPAQVIPSAVTVPAPVTATVRPTDPPPPPPPKPPANVAVTDFAVVIDTVQIVLVPEHAPLQPEKVAPKSGVAVSVTEAPAAWAALHPEPVLEQASPAPEIDPVPFTWELRTYVVFPPAKDATADWELVMVSVHVVEKKPKQSFVQPLKLPDVPEAGTAVSVTVEPDWTFAVQPGPPAAVQ